MIMMTNLTAKVIRLRQTPEESILQVFIPDYQHDVDDDYHDHIALADDADDGDDQGCDLKLVGRSV